MAGQELTEKIDRAIDRLFDRALESCLYGNPTKQVHMRLVAVAEFKRSLKEAGYEKPETLADLKMRAKKRPDLVIGE